MNLFRWNKAKTSAEDEAFGYDNMVDVSGEEYSNSNELELYETRLRGLAVQIMPRVENTLESQKALFLTLCDAISPVSIMAYGVEENYWGKFDASSETYKIVAHVARDADSWLSYVPLSNIDEVIDRTNTKKLVAAWGVLDFYIYIVQPEYSVNLRSLRNRITEYLYNSELEIECEHITPFEIMLREYHADCTGKNATGGQKSDNLKRDICKCLLELPKLYIAYDKFYRSDLPLMDADGLFYVFTSEKNAYDTRVIFEKKGNDFAVGPLENEKIRKFFENMKYCGFDKVIINDGEYGITLPIDAVVDSEEFIVDSDNGVLRREILRCLQITGRYNALCDTGKLRMTNRLHMKKMIQSSRKTVNTLVSDGIVYVLVEGTYINDVTLYSRNAYEIISKELVAEGEDVSVKMTSPDSSSSGVANSVRKIGVVNIADKGAYACVFTNRTSAEKTRLQFLEGGTENNIVAVTFEEIFSLIRQCDGLAIDISQNGYLIPAPEFDMFSNK